MTVPAEGEAELEAQTTRRSSPYQGLVPFGESDAEWFFGRDDARDIVLDSLRAYRLSVLYGESGVGKSSLLGASVLAHLRRESRSSLTLEGNPAILAVPFSSWSLEDPASALKAAVRQAAGELAPKLAADAPEETLAEILAIWSERVGGDVFVILDQVEELFLYHPVDEAGRAVEQELAGAVRRREGGANFLLAIREDALAKLDRLQARVPGLLDNLVRLEHLDERAAREAIERPLEHWNRVEAGGVAIEPPLVEQILAQVQAGKLLLPGAGGAGQVKATGGEARIEAPYLQLVLARIWDEERSADSDLLRLETLERLGGAERIVRTHLDGVLARFSRRDRRAAANAFRYLVTPSGTKIAHRPNDLAEYAGVPVEKLTYVVEALAGEVRILRPVASGAYEIYHDVLADAVLDWRRRYEENRSRGLLARTVVLFAAAAAAAIMVVAYLGDVLSGLEDRTIDARFSIRDPRPPSDIAIVGIDDATFDQLRMEWPFRRSLHGRVVDRLRRDGANAIAFNVQFTEPTQPAQDRALIEAVGRARNVVLATTEIDLRGQTAVLGGDALLERLHARAGHSEPAAEADGVVRRVPWGVAETDPVTGRPGRRLQSFGLVAAEVATNRRIHPSQLGGESTNINYAGGPGTIAHVSYWRVLRGRFKPGTFRGRTAVIGAVAPSLQDRHRTPLAGLMSGAELHANVVHTALRGFPLRPKAERDIPLIALLGMLVPLVSLRLGWTASLAVALTAGGMYVVAAQLAFNQDALLPVVYPLLALLLAAALVLGWHFRTRRPR